MTDGERARRFLVTRAPVTIADEPMLAAEFAAVRNEERERWERIVGDALCEWCRQHKPLHRDDRGFYHGWRVRGGERQEDCAADEILRRAAEEEGSRG